MARNSVSSRILLLYLIHWLVAIYRANFCQDRPGQYITAYLKVHLKIKNALKNAIAVETLENNEIDFQKVS